ncbi:MAG: hypothetical protein ABFD89_26575 [Bryobacteraceae bacterium]
MAIRSYLIRLRDECRAQEDLWMDRAWEQLNILASQRGAAQMMAIASLYAMRIEKIDAVLELEMD